MSARLQQAGKWFAKCLSCRPASIWSGLCETRRHLRSWTDASGVDGIVCVFLLVDGVWDYRDAKVPDVILSQLLPRRDL